MYHSGLIEEYLVAFRLPDRFSDEPFGSAYFGGLDKFDFLFNYSVFPAIPEEGWALEFNRLQIAENGNSESGAFITPTVKVAKLSFGIKITIIPAEDFEQVI